MIGVLFQLRHVVWNTLLSDPGLCNLCSLVDKYHGREIKYEGFGGRTGHILGFLCSVFTARCYASAVLAMALCLSVRPSVRHKSVFY